MYCKPIEYYLQIPKNMNPKASHTQLVTAAGLIVVLLLTGALFIAAQAQQTHSSATALFSPLDHLLKDIQDKDGLRLKLVKNHDPYGIGMQNPASAGNEQYLLLTADMTFCMWDRSQKNEGYWNANGYAETLTFHCTSVNGTGIPEQVSYTFEVKAYSPDQLTLLTVGKQGAVEMVYQPLPLAEKQAFQLSYGQ